MRPAQTRTCGEHLTDAQCAFIATRRVTFCDIDAVALIINTVVAMLRTKAVSMLTKTIAGRIAHLLSHFAVVEHRLLTLAVLAHSHPSEKLLHLATLSQARECSLRPPPKVRLH